MSKNQVGTITSTELRELLQTAGTKLSAREEKALRMTSGAGVDPKAPLPRRGQKSADAQAELLALEAELIQKLAARAESQPAAAPQPTRSEQKDRIIRALRRLK